MWYFNDFFCSGQKTREIIVIDVLVCISFHDFFFGLDFFKFSGPTTTTCYNISDKILFIISFSFTVCGSSQRPTTFGIHLVRGFAWFPANEHDFTIFGSLSNRTTLPLILTGLHYLSLGQFLSKAKETIHQVYMHFCVIFYIPV